MSEIKLGLERISKLLDKLDNPQDKLKCIHIAGTNGKGSVGAYLESIMCCLGKKVGRYVSPAVFDSMEIIQISGQNITNSEYCKKKEYLELIDSEATLFEIETAMAFWYFSENECDICIIETGLGGRMDATNVVTNPLCVILTSISMDHMGFLGDTLEDIAREKCGIIKNNTKVITGTQDCRVYEIINDTSNKMNSELYVADINDVLNVSFSLDGTCFSYDGMRYKTTMLGKNQVENAIIAIKTAMCLDISLDIIYDGVVNTSWSGRFEKICDEPIMILDGAHNEKAAINLSESLEQYFKNKNIIYVCGVLKDKEYDKILKIMSKNSERIITFKPNNDRGLDSSVLCKVARKYYKYVYDASCINRAISVALQAFFFKHDKKFIDRKINNNINNKIEIDKYFYQKGFINEKEDLMDSDFIDFSDKETVIVIFGSLSFMKEIYERHECDE